MSINTHSPSGAGGSAYFYHSDHLGSSSLITDDNGEIVQHIEYVPFGETFIDERRSQSSWTTPYLFSGKERDEETGLLYFGARYQDSKYGIWYSVDPLAEKYPNISSYVYCADNPVKFIDPDGRSIKPWWPWHRLISNDRNDPEVLEGFRNKDSYIAFGSGYTDLKSRSYVFQKCMKIIQESKKNTYFFVQNYSFPAGSGVLDGGRYDDKRKAIEFYHNIDRGTIFEEIFHAAQSEFYGSSFKSENLSIEFEAKVAKIGTALKLNIPEIIKSDIVLNSLDKSTVSIISDYFNGNQVDQNELKKAFDILHTQVKLNYPEYKDDVSKNKESCLKFIKAISQ